MRRRGWKYRHPPNGSFTINRNSTQYNGLMGWWPLGTGQYGMVRDVLGRWHMTAYNTPTLVADGERGISTLFDDGSSEYLEVTQTPVTTPPFTALAWFNSNSNSVDQAIMGIGGDPDFTGWMVMAQGNTVGDPIGVYVVTGADTSFVTTTGYSIDTWHHAAFVAKAANNWAVLLDGGSKGTSAVAVALADLARTSIGAFHYGGGGIIRAFSGKIADVRLYNYALSDAEVWDQYVNPWDLILPVRRWFVASVAAAGIAVPPLYYHYVYH